MTSTTSMTEKQLADQQQAIYYLPPIRSTRNYELRRSLVKAESAPNGFRCVYAVRNKETGHDEWFEFPLPQAIESMHALQRSLDEVEAKPPI